MFAMFEGITLGVVLFAVGVLLIFIGMPRHGVTPRFLRFDAAMVTYPAVIITFLAVGTALILRAL
ncbi:MAG: hypothetical protein WA322_13415 [Pseudolabrys sp.]